jgi:hypothetical protein
VGWAGGYRCRRHHAFDGGIFRVGFFGIGSTLIDAHTLPEQTEGLKGCVRYGWIGGRCVRCMRYGRIGGRREK